APPDNLTDGEHRWHSGWRVRLRSVGALLSRVRALLPSPSPDGGPKSLRSPWTGYIQTPNLTI
ncbi:hypothetical protein PoB_005886600, partial [Plakobranchus ocellatus]